MKIDIKRQSMYLILLMLLVFGGAVSVQAATYPASVTAKVDRAESGRFLKKLNALRKKQGTAAVQIDRTLQDAAEQRAAELVVRYAHTRPNGGTPPTLSAKISAENIASGQADAKDVYTAWKDSPMHYQNMIRTNMRSVGICCLRYQGRAYWVNLFGTGRAQAMTLKGQETKTFKIDVAEKYLTASNISLGSSNRISTREKRTMRIAFRCSQNERAGSLPNSFFTFKSSDPRVLKVSQKGVMTSLKKGRAKITVQSRRYKKLKKTFQIVVKDSSWMDYIDYSDD